MNLPRKRVKGSRMNRLGVNTNQVICRDLAEMGITVHRKRFRGGRAFHSTVSRIGGGNASLRLVKLLSSKNIRDRVRRLFTLLHVTTRRNIGGICIRKFLSKHSINPRATTNCVGRARRGVGRCKINRFTAVSKHCCSVSHSGH